MNEDRRRAGSSARSFSNPGPASMMATSPPRLSQGRPDPLARSFPTNTMPATAAGSVSVSDRRDRSPRHEGRRGSRNKPTSTRHRGAGGGTQRPFFHRPSNRRVSVSSSTSQDRDSRRDSRRGSGLGALSDARRYGRHWKASSPGAKGSRAGNLRKTKHPSSMKDKVKNLMDAAKCGYQNVVHDILAEMDEQASTKHMKHRLVNGETKDGRRQEFTPLMLACMGQAVFEEGELVQMPIQEHFGHCVILLLEYGADVDAKSSNTNERSALHFCALQHFEMEQVANYLLAAKANVNQVDGTEYAYESGSFKDGDKELLDDLAAKYELTRGFATSAFSVTSSSTRSTNSTTNMNKDDQKAALEALKRLFTRKRDKATIKKLKTFFEQGNKKAIRLNLRKLLRKTGGNAPLHYAAENGHLKILRSLLEYNANVQATNIKGEVALHLAAEHGWVNIVSELFQHGAEPMPETDVSWKSRSPLHYAFIRLGRLEEVIEKMKRAPEKGTKTRERVKVSEKKLHLQEHIRHCHPSRILSAVCAVLQLTSFSRGEKVLARYRGKEKNHFATGKIARVNTDGTYDVKYDDGKKAARRVQARFIQKATSTRRKSLRRDDSEDTALLSIMSPRNSNQISKDGKLDNAPAATDGYIKKIFDKYDTDHNNELSVEEFKEAMDELLGKTIGDEQDRMIFSQMLHGGLDKDRNAGIDFEEFKVLFDDAAIGAVLEEERGLRQLFELQLSNQDQLINKLLDNGANLEHKDSNGKHAFKTNARWRWFERPDHVKRMSVLDDNPNEKATDDVLFKDPRTQSAMKTVFREGGLRQRAVAKAVAWLIFLIIFSVVAVRNSGRNSFSSFSFEWGIRQLFEQEEFDDLQHFSFGDIGSIDEYYGWLGNAALPGLYDDRPIYYTVPDEGAKERVSFYEYADGPRIGKHNVLVGRPRLRQLRTSADSCSAMPARIGPSSSKSDDPDTIAEGWPCFQDTGWGNDDDQAPFSIDNTAHSSSTFQYLDEEDTLSVYGRFGYYGSGGHSLILPPNKTTAIAIVERLQNSPWISMNTRAVILEFNVFNRARQLLTTVHFTLELGQTGAIMPTVRFDTLQLVNYVSWVDFCLEFLLVGAMIVLVNKEVKQFWNEKNWAEDFREHAPRCCGGRCTIYRYLYSFYNWMDLLLVLLFLVIAFLHGLSWQLKTEVAWKEQEKWVDVSSLVLVSRLKMNFMAWNLFICWVKMLEPVQAKQ